MDMKRMQLYPHQNVFKQDIYKAWDGGAQNVMAVLPTGGGKTVVLSDIIHDHNAAACAIAHRQELVGQISIALARDDVPHRIVGPTSVVRLIVGQHMAECGMSYYTPSSKVAVAGVDTLIRRRNELSGWANKVSLWVQDEGHHVLKKNKWGKAAAMFPNAKGLAPTATPIRADGMGLGRHADGLMDAMVEGPTMRELIDAGWLTEYRIFAPPGDLDLTNVPTGSGGEFSKAPLKVAVQKSHVVGDVVKHYLKLARGKLGITFATDVETAIYIAQQYNAANVSAAVISANTPDAERIRLIADFKARKLLQLVNVDLFGEGFDLPAIEVVSMARPTQSFALYCQQFGRALRLMEGKHEALIIDHVGNVQRHGLPDAARVWTLDRRDKCSKVSPTDAIPVRTCPECTAVYERTHKGCPYCGHYAEPALRSGPEYVDGDLTELDPATLAKMRGEINRIDGPFYGTTTMSKPAMIRGSRIHNERKEIQEALRLSIAWWAGYQRAAGRSDSESYKRFYFMFGVDVMTAQTLNSKDAIKLAEQINLKLGAVW